MEGMGGMNFWAGKSVLVTGATGLVGSWLTRALLDNRANVVALVCELDPQSELIRSGTFGQVVVVNGRLEDRALVERSVNEHEIDTIFHLGAQTLVGTARRAPVSTFESNIQGTWNVLEAARLCAEQVQRVVVASSDKAYGEQPQLPYVENMPLIGRAPYDVSKSCADLLSQSYHASYGLPVTIARCGNIYGGGDLNWSRIVPGTIRSLLRGEQPVIRSDGTLIRDYLYVDDVVSAYLLLGETIGDGFAGEAFNFSDESPMSVLDIYQAICEIMGSDVEPAVLGQAAGEIQNQHLSAAKATAALGWKTKFHLQEGLVRTVDWYTNLLHGSPRP